MNTAQQTDNMDFTNLVPLGTETTDKQKMLRFSHIFLKRSEDTFEKQMELISVSFPELKDGITAEGAKLLCQHLSKVCYEKAQ
jgi:hypothetical protein